MKLVDAENIRKYVIVCNEHKAMLKDTLLFWGSLTDDNEERSFSGYTCQIDKCERYTRQELEEWRGNLKKEYPFFDELKKATDAETLICSTRMIGTVSPLTVLETAQTRYGEQGLTLSQRHTIVDLTLGYLLNL